MADTTSFNERRQRGAAGSAGGGARGGKFVIDQSAAEQRRMLTQQLFNGLLLGATFCLVALGFNLVVGAGDRLNVALGETAMVSAMIGAILMGETGWPFALAFPAAMVAGGVVAVVSGGLVPVRASGLPDRLNPEQPGGSG